MSATPYSSSCLPNYFMGAPPRDNPSQKVLVAEKLATTCGIDTSVLELNMGGTGSQLVGKPGGIVYAHSATQLAITDAGDYGSVLAANGSGAPFWTNVNFPLVVGPLGTIIRSDGVNWVASTSTYADTYPDMGILYSEGGDNVLADSTFTYSSSTNNLQLGLKGVSIGVSAGIGTQSVAVGQFAGQVAQDQYSVAVGLQSGQGTQGSRSVAIGIQAGQTAQGSNSIAIGAFSGSNTQSSLSIAIGNLAGNSTQGPNAVALGSTAGNFAQGDSSVAIGNNAGANSQGTLSVAIGAVAGTTNQGASAVAIGENAGYDSQGTQCVAIGSQAAQTYQQSSAIAIGRQAGRLSQGTNSIAIGIFSALTNQGINSVAIGNAAGGNSQGARSVAIGVSAGTVSQGASAVAIGDAAGGTGQQTQGVAIGRLAAQFTQGQNAVAIGNSAGRTSQNQSAVAIGDTAGANGQATQGVAIGVQAGQASQGANAIAIGALAGQTSQTAGSICLNASGVVLNPTQAGFYVNPVRTAALAANAVTLTYSNNEVVVNSGKTFVIDHPETPDTHYLVHACLEGPEAGVYYRGQGMIFKGDVTTEIVLPSYVEQLANHFTVHLTPWNVPLPMAAKPIKDGILVVCVAQPQEQDVAFSWTITGQRHPIQTKVLKTTATTHGFGPYQYLQFNK